MHILLGMLPVHWTIKLDPRGEKSFMFQCKHVNYLEKLTNVAGEGEYLFAPYSVFTVVSVTVTLTPNIYHTLFHSSRLLSLHWTIICKVPVQPSAGRPIEICLEAAVDNRDHPDDLPISPWYSGLSCSR